MSGSDGAISRPATTMDRAPGGTRRSKGSGVTGDQVSPPSRLTSIPCSVARYSVDGSRIDVARTPEVSRTTCHLAPRSELRKIWPGLAPEPGVSPGR